MGRHFTIIVVAEGAKPRGGAATIKQDAAVGGVERLGGVCEMVAEYVEKETGKETRTLTLGHLQRGGSPTTFDRLLALRFGAAAVRAVADGKFGQMVALDPPHIITVPLEQALVVRGVPLDDDRIQTAREMGICLGD